VTGTLDIKGWVIGVQLWGRLVEVGMLCCRLSAVPLVAGFLFAGSALADAGEQRALLELFTSQGCSSCPAADKLLGELAADPSLVAISVPIDIWDYLGWKDTLANPKHSARQRAYAKARGDREVYTPQIVVNGATQVLGSDAGAVERAITVTDRNTAVMSTAVALTLHGTALKVDVSALKDHGGGEVWLCPLTRSIAVNIARGENHGHTVTYHNVVRRWIKLGSFAGTEALWNVPLADVLGDDIDAAAVMVQQGSREEPGIVLGAALAPIARQTSQVR
jgi:hypothetical protein